MKNAILFLCLSLSVSLSLSAQQVIQAKPCTNADMQLRADSIKTIMTNSGYTVMREVNVTMESEYEQPIVLPMQGGGMYHFVFIGDPSSKLYELRVYDYEEREIVYKKFKKELDGNIIAVNINPDLTQYHMFKPVQVSKEKKKKDLCGYMMLFKRTK